MTTRIDSAFIDGFPFDPADPDYTIHAAIDGELRNCDALRGTNATPGLLYPACSHASSQERQAWLEPALRRFAWNAGREPWDKHLRGLLRLLIGWTNPPASDSALLLLARLGPQLEANRGSDDCEVANAIDARLKTMKGPLPPELMDALRTLIAHLIGTHCHGVSTFDIAWRLWRAPENPDDGYPCFSARVRADLRALPPAWEEFFERRKDTERDGKLRRKAVTRIGRESFAARWDEWIACIEADRPADLSAAGRDLLVLFLNACIAEPAIEIDNTLYRLSGIRWAGTGNRRLTKEWLGRLLVAVAMRPASKAFACAERLMHNPDTSFFPEVAALYNQLLAERASGEGLSASQIGVDGYDLALEPALYRQQLILDHYLHGSIPVPHAPGGPETVWDADEMLPLLIRRQAAADRTSFIRAIASRSCWMRLNVMPPRAIHTAAGEEKVRVGADQYRRWVFDLHQIQSLLLKDGADLTHDDIVALIDADAAVKGTSATNALLCQAEAFVKRHGYTAQMVEALQRWQASQFGSPSALRVRHRIGWLLWLEDVAPIREKDCWSQRLRADLRKMPATLRTPWRAVFENTSLANRPKPSPSWEKRACAALGQLPEGEFRSRLLRWFEPFRTGEKLHLTVCGRDALRNLLWCAALVKDPVASAAAGWLASAAWRTRRDLACVRVLLPEAEPEEAPPDDRVFEAIERIGASGVRIEDGHAIVTGVRDSYEVDVHQLRIVRRSDGRTIRLDFAFSNPALAELRLMLDNRGRVEPLHLNVLRLLLSLRLLIKDDIYAANLAADTE